MKVVSNSLVTRIYPFVKPDKEPLPLSDIVFIYPHAIRVECHGAMSYKAARILAEAINKAADIAEGLAGRESTE